MLEWVFSGVLDRHQSLQIILAEVDCGWMPYFAEQADDNYLRHAFADLKDVKLRLLPSEYMSRVLLPDLHHRPLRDRQPRTASGVDRMLWSNDYPHITSDWPYSWKTINASFAGVPADETARDPGGQRAATAGPRRSSWPSSTASRGWRR